MAVKDDGWSASIGSDVAFAFVRETIDTSQTDMQR